MGFIFTLDYASLVMEIAMILFHMIFSLLQLMNLLFSFLEPNRPHSALLAGYFSKVCLFMF